ncbi:hypothetical protein PoB_003041400, partial [Plakobranchus ocellatus]
MASCRVHCTAIFVLLCTTICISNGRIKRPPGCKSGNKSFHHGTIVMMPISCKVYRCERSKLRYKYK